jgi:hypothetical protein
MKRKQLFLLGLWLMAVAMLSTSCVNMKMGMSGDAVTEYRSLKGFEKIEISGSPSVYYAQADSFSVKVQAPNVDEMMKVETVVEGNELKISMKNGSHFLHFGDTDADDIKVYVTSPDFLGVRLMGSGDFMSAQPLDTDTLTIELRGSGDIRFNNVICDKVSVSLIGSGDVSLDRVQAQWGQLDVIGSGDIEAFFDQSGEVNAQVKGSGDIEMKGTVRKMNKLVRGSGDIDTDELIVR